MTAGPARATTMRARPTSAQRSSVQRSSAQRSSSLGSPRRPAARPPPCRPAWSTASAQMRGAHPWWAWAFSWEPRSGSWRGCRRGCRLLSARRAEPIDRVPGSADLRLDRGLDLRSEPERGGLRVFLGRACRAAVELLRLAGWQVAPGCVGAVELLGLAGRQVGPGCVGAVELLGLAGWEVGEDGRAAESLLGLAGESVSRAGRGADRVGVHLYPPCASHPGSQPRDILVGGPTFANSCRGGVLARLRRLRLGRDEDRGGIASTLARRVPRLPVRGLGSASVGDVST